MNSNYLHHRIQQISRYYMNGRPPIPISELQQEFLTTDKEILSALKELERRGLISFYSSGGAIKLTQKGMTTITAIA